MRNEIKRIKNNFKFRTDEQLESFESGNIISQ